MSLDYYTAVNYLFADVALNLKPVNNIPNTFEQQRLRKGKS